MLKPDGFERVLGSSLGEPALIGFGQLRYWRAACRRVWCIQGGVDLAKPSGPLRSG